MLSQRKIQGAKDRGLQNVSSVLLGAYPFWGTPNLRNEQLGIHASGVLEKHTYTQMQRNKIWICFKCHKKSIQHIPLVDSPFFVD